MEPLRPPAKNPFVMPITVVADDIDAQGHVSNVKVLDWMNQAAIAHSDALGYDVARYKEIGGIFVVRRHEIDYLSSAYLEEELLLYTWPSGIKRVAAERSHELQRPSDGAVVARGMNVWVWVDMASGKPTRIPPDVSDAFHPKHFV